MSLDLDTAEINAIFFEESAEGVDVMESGLLKLSPDNTDVETINNIFRAAHSMKCALTFCRSNAYSTSVSMKLVMSSFNCIVRPYQTEQCKVGSLKFI
jgi:chemotaxis protein histidine kinase CheA